MAHVSTAIFISTGKQVVDVPIDSIIVDYELMIYPHEICPVDGIVIDGQGSMDESYLTGEPFLMQASLSPRRGPR